MPPTKHRLLELDALRGIASLMVMVFHFSIIAGFDFMFLRIGVTGVDLFFLISGYVIFMTLSKTKTSYDFIVSRFARLFPAYFVMMMITILLIYLFRRADVPGWKTILGNLTMQQPLFFVEYIDDSYWTLTVELQFYILMLLLFMSGKLQQIEKLGPLILLGFLVYYVIAYHYFFNTKLYIIPRALFPLISHFQLFLAGIIFYRMANQGITVRRNLIILFCFLVNVYLFNETGRSHFFIQLPLYTTLMLFYFGCFYLFLFGKLGILKLQFLVFFGDISYSLYLIHQEAGKLVYPYLMSVNRFAIINLLIIGAAVIAVAALVTYGIEKPAVYYIRNKLSAFRNRVAA